MKKELKERRVKLVLQKLEAHLKNVLHMGQDQINMIASLTEDECERLYEEENLIENEIQRDLEELVPEQSYGAVDLAIRPQTQSDSSVLENLTL